MSLTTVYNSTAKMLASIGNGVNPSTGNSNFHKEKLEYVISSYNCTYGDNVSIISSDDKCSKVILTKPKDQFKLITKIEAIMSGKKKFTESEDGLIMTRIWD